VGNLGAASSADDVLAAEPVIRRVVAARVANPSDVDDLVQDCLERLLGACGRLAPETVLPYGIVTARNLVVSHARASAQRARIAPRLVEAREPDRPEDAVLGGEARRAMTAALAQLSSTERQDVLAYYGEDSQPSADAAPESRGALRVRMARTRAKLRLEYLLAFRHVTLPTPRCRSVLLAVSAGDTRRQRQLDVGQHLLDCETCAVLSEPLDQRSVALTALTFPAALAARFLARARAHPVQAGSAVAGTAAAAAAAVVASGVLAASPHPPQPPRAAVPVPTSPAAALGGLISRLSIGGEPANVLSSVRATVGQPADATGVVVEMAVTRNGFWVGSAAARMWVQLEGPLRPLHIVAGDRLQFSGTVVANGPSYAARAGVSSHADIALLGSQGAHILVETTRIRVLGR
jgi:RNA polymerase sigma factor (sigma-70 family)